ncbi:NAD(P)H-quinone oxidoreductase subunit 2, chloroplastic [Bdellovibrio bacteriovorus]|nr:NADH dehydrogenase [Bdellovibrio bacteriovorus]BEV68706.1 NAD(P)H-quinone oxidoreductase subunit 2, chloroplastic [Bdellovibrio bacteriovorus]
MLMYWVIFFFLLALTASLCLRLPAVIWRVIFLLPYLGAFGESLKPFIEQSWPFPRDGLTDFFACIVSGIGACVCVYAGTYFKTVERRRFFPLFFAFTGCMLGVLWADNIFVFYGFWEATGLCSFLLIGFKFADPDVRKGAKQALVLNIAGGLCLLLALLMLSQASGSNSLLDILYGRTEYQHSQLTMLMIMIAAMIKSAQFPFHFWLPGAMVAPTPASCYLHSATMVKLGVFLLARFSPLFDQNLDWLMTLGLVGAATLIWGMIVSLTKTDLKQLFAWTTVSSLGGMCMLVGLHEAYSWKAFFSYILAHSLYKASLFMCVGNIDKQMGGRSLDHVSGLYRRMPLTSLALLMALGSMMGLPFSMGFLSKEYLFKSALALKFPGSFLVLALLGASIMSIVVGYRLIVVIFARQEDRQVLREVPTTMWGPPLLLASCGWMAGFFLADINKYFLNPVVSSIVLRNVELNLEMWTGVNLALILSLISLGLGTFLAARYAGVVTKAAVWLKGLYKPSPRVGYMGTLAKKIMDRLQSGRLSFYILWMLMVPCLILPWVLPLQEYVPSLKTDELILFQMIPFVLVTLGLLPMLLSVKPLLKVVGLGVVGIGISLFYLSVGAADLAMTQMAVETLSVVVLTLSLVFLRPNPSGFSVVYRSVRGIVTTGAFVGALLLCGVMADGKLSSRVADYYRENAHPLGKGLNVVNVILVDFRAMDTFGEITVLGIVAMGVQFMLLRRRRLNLTLRPSTILHTSVRVMAPLFTLISLILLLRGHNAPGGGFIAGLVLAISFTFYGLVFGEQWARRVLVLKPLSWVCTGLVVAFVAGWVPVLLGKPFLTAVWLPGSLAFLGTPLLFDVGVYLLVLGMGTSLFFAFLRRDV